MGVTNYCNPSVYKHREHLYNLGFALLLEFHLMKFHEAYPVDLR